MNSKKRKQGPSTTQNKADKPATLKEMLDAGTVAKLKQRAEQLKQQEAEQQEKRRAEAEAARQAEQKLKEQDFEYLLNNTRVDGNKYK